MIEVAPKNLRKFEGSIEFGCYKEKFASNNSEIIC